ncbi:hypothetical protein LTR62_005413 [Meristemomyces frigidus]|uniref:Transcription factor SipA3 n=1 Tax=Meristemomyces frigidus TaxID=1508187 RepID=A0AAN7TD13_9PEZI|nr:hypothetical protein LTR62_005413 [Meristemomyces frigidus]
MADSNNESPPPPPPPTQPTVTPVNRPLNLIPVTLKEAALDSPTFRATSTHFADQIDTIERWLDNYLRAATKLVAEVTTLENAVNSFLAHSAPPSQISEAVLDHDYTLLAARRYGEGARDWWGSMLKGAKRYDVTVIEPIRTFLNVELKNFKEARKALETTQKTFDHVISRYLSQSKAKEASSLREDAFQVHEARKAYLKASMDFCTLAPTLRTNLDKAIVKVFVDQWKEMMGAREANGSLFARKTVEMERVRGWSKEMESSERAFKWELSTARRQIEEEAQSMTRPSRELEDYAASTVPYLGAGASSAGGIASPAKLQTMENNEKQSWLYQKTTVGKPARTVWTRRWFFVKNGIFGWLIQGARSGGVEESDRIGVLLCSVRPAFQEERRFCFDVKTKDTSIILQAETQQELTEWISAFEMAKRKALEDPASTDSPSLTRGGVDPAFAISPPVAPEFAAKMDHHIADDSTVSQASQAEREATFGPATSRSSFDVSQPVPSSARRVLSLEREPGEGNREHAARIMSKLDLSKRNVSGQTSSGPSSTGGIASLISASHNVLPVGPGAGVTPAPSTSGYNQLDVAKRIFSMPMSTLAPSTLANPPAATNLSHTAVVISGEKGVSLGRGIDGSGMPSSLMANLWGSSNWGYVNRLGPEPPAKREGQKNPISSPRVGSSGQTRDDVNIMDGGADNSATSASNLLALDTNLAAGLKHRKTLSISTDTPAMVSSRNTTSQESEEFPNNYPPPLKAQQAQFRMLFPSVRPHEKVVLVFRATWNPNEQEFPGRVYVTTEQVYFYSNYLGLVLVTGASLRGITDVTAAPGRDCDFLYLHFRPRTTSEGVQGAEDMRRVTVKVFLEPLRLLQRRLDYLVHNANSDSPAGLEEVLKALIRMETHEPQRSSSLESWEEPMYFPDSPDTRAGEQQMSGGGGRRERNVKSAIRVDGSLFDRAKTGREVQKFKLPTQAVVYSPQGTQASISRDFNVSAKALFHVIFGDKSAVFQMLYHHRWADKTVQSPWTKKAGDGIGAHWTRQFGSAGSMPTPLRDEQRVDVFNDHLCYVVTNTKAPWRLPYAKRFVPTTKFVITHTAKSKCKLAVFQTITWTSPPAWPYVKHLVERQALAALEADALDLTNVAMDQVAKLGSHSKTNRAIEIFGSIGQQTESQTIDTASVPAASVPKSMTMKNSAQQPTHLTRLILEDVIEKILQSIGWLLDVAMATSKGFLGVFSAHTFLVALLAVSALYNSWYGYRESVTWWQERRAGRFMKRMGIQPSPLLGRAVYLSDLDEMVSEPVITARNVTVDTADLQHGTGGSKTCRTTFTDQLTSSVSHRSPPSGREAARFHQTRANIARYRHDLLVAIRVVNRVDRDLIEAEWEQWLQTETKQCEDAERMLGGSNTAHTVDLEAELGREFVEYCGTCRVDLAAVGNGTGGLM